MRSPWSSADRATAAGRRRPPRRSPERSAKGSPNRLFRRSLQHLLKGSLFEYDRFESLGLIGHGALRRQALHRRCAVKAMAAFGRSQDEFGVLRLCDRTAVDENDRLRVHMERRARPLVHEFRAFFELPPGMRANY